ncbi:MAG: hypothetical protein V4568_17285 [Pseudomonadota bacterium]
MQLSLAQVCPGMVLADDVFDTRGNLILKQGTLLTESVLNSLRRYKIQTIAVVAQEGEVVADEVDDAVAKQQIQERLDRLFRHTSDDVATRSLRDWVGEYRLGSKKS